MQVRAKSGWLTVDFSGVQHCLSWAVCGAGARTAERVVWAQVQDKDLPPDSNPEIFLERRLKEQGWAGAVGMLTSASVADYQDVILKRGNFWARCIATVGMTNALRIGDAPAMPAMFEPARTGTLNLLCAVSENLSAAAMIEALSLAVEARTAAVLDAGISSIQTGEKATGTGTDCVVITCPQASSALGRPVIYIGKHTELGSLIGAATYAAIEAGLKIWKEKMRTVSIS